MRLPHSLAALAAVSMLAPAGCADTSPSSDEIVDGADGKLDADSRAVVGSWNVAEISTEPNPEAWLALVLKTDKRFYLWPEAGDGVEGTYKLTHTNADPPTHFLVLMTDAGDEIRREYRVEAADQLFVRRSGGTWREMERAESAVCVVTDDCALQNLKHVSCVGSWVCSDDGACGFDCQ